MLFIFYEQINLISLRSIFRFRLIYSIFLQLRLFLFVCPAKPLWSLAPVQPLTMAYNKFRRLVLTCKLPEEVYDS